MVKNQLCVRHPPTAVPFSSLASTGSAAVTSGGGGRLRWGVVHKALQLVALRGSHAVPVADVRDEEWWHDAHVTGFADYPSDCSEEKMLALARQLQDKETVVCTAR